MSSLPFLGAEASLNVHMNGTRMLPKSPPMNTADSNSPICTHRPLNYPLMNNPSIDLVLQTLDQRHQDQRSGRFLGIIG